MMRSHCDPRSPRSSRTPRGLAAGATAACAGLLAACAPVEEDGYSAAAADSDGRACFFVQQVSGYREAPDSPDGNERIFVDVGASDTYLFETFGACPELDWSWQIGFDTRSFTSICDGRDVDLIVRDPAMGPRRCPVRMITKLEDRADTVVD